MTKISLKILLIALISSFVFFFNSDSSKCCGPEYVYDDFYKIFEEELFDIKNLAPFYLTEYIFNNVDENTSIGPRLDNLKEWLEYFENKPTIDDLEKFIYDSNEKDLQSFSEQDFKKIEKWKNNSVLIYAEKKKLNKAIYYLLFAKQIEPYVAYYNTWEEPKRDSVAMSNLLTTALSMYDQNNDLFFKERLAYQAIRLAHYSKQYNKTISLYEQFFGKSKSKNLMYNWSLGHYAGAIKLSGNIAKANVLFARLFDTCPSRSRQSLRSFKFDWQDSLLTETLKLCESDHDKVVVYTLKAYKDEYKDIEPIENIYKYEPDSPYLLLILSRAISMLERETLPAKSPWYGYTGYINPEYNNGYFYSDSSLYKTVNKIADENRTKNGYLWNFAAGYVSTLQNQTKDAEKYFFQAKRLCPKENMDFIKRVQIAELICKVNSIKKIDEKTEEWLAKDVRWLKETSSLKKLRAEDALLYIMNTLSKQYWVQGDTIKSHLCFGISGKNKPWEDFFTSKNPFNYNISIDYHKQPVGQIYKMIKAYDYWDTPWDEKHISDWLKFLMDNYYYSIKDLENILAKKYIAKGMFEEAVSKIESHLENIDYYHQNSDVTEEFLADPFLINISDCHDCDYRTEKKVTYRLLSFSRRMIELKNLAVTEKNNEKASEYYFLLANGYYNITFFGNGWMASCFNSRDELGWGYSDGENYDLYDCSKAEDNYLKAAIKTKNKEFAAQCYFMAAKCEQNRFYNEEHPEVYMWYSSKKINDKEKIKFEKYKTYFKKLVKDYSNTQFFKEALKECKYFNYFVTHN